MSKGERERNSERERERERERQTERERESKREHIVSAVYIIFFSEKISVRF
jgi:hypothetical protein